MSLMVVRQRKPKERVHTVIVDDECVCYGSSPFESEYQEEDEFANFEELAIYDYKGVLGLQGIARCQPRPNSAEDAEVQLSETDIKLEPMGKSMQEFEETKEVDAQLDMGEATVMEAKQATETDMSARN